MGTLSGVMDSMIASSAKDRGFDPQNIKIGIFCFSVQHAGFRSKSKDGSAQNNLSG